MLCHELGNVGIGSHKESDIAHVSVKEHLIDVACGDCLLVDDSTNVEAFCHIHIVEVFHESNSLAHTHSLGCKTSQDIGFCIAVPAWV